MSYLVTFASYIIPACVSIIAEVTAQADDGILESGTSELFVQIKLTEKRSRWRLLIIMVL